MMKNLIIIKSINFQWLSQVFVLLLSLTILLGCKVATADPSDVNELVLKDGMRIVISNSYGSMTIEGKKDLIRLFTWNSATREVLLLPRRERWYGSLGGYYPGSGEHWKKHDGITRAVVDEGQQHFSNIDEALSWIHKNCKASFVYRDDGLGVAWEKVTGGGGTLIVDIWQILINGKKPEHLPGSQNDKIIVTY